LGSDSSFDKRRRIAGDIIRRHLASGAQEPVNVDSHARQAAIDGLESAAPGLFATAQKQIYNLMKFDSFSRFLKSDLYKESLVAEMSGKPLRFDPSGSEADPDLDIGSALMDPKASLGRKSKFDKRESEIGANPPSEPSRRRSLLPSWNNLRGGSSSSKDRSKSKDRADLNLKKSKEDQKRLTATEMDSHSSSHNTSNESEEGAACKLARVILPDKVTFHLI
jgi:regulator of G-protein signaling